MCDDNNDIPEIEMQVEFPSGVIPLRRSLQECTEIYFRISTAVRNPHRPDITVSCGEAIQLLRMILNNVSDTRKVWRRANDLQWVIIELPDPEEMTNG